MNGFSKRLEELRERASRMDEARRGRWPVGVLFFDGEAWTLNGVTYETEDAARDAFTGEVLILADV